MKKRLMILEVSQKQAYIFASKKLQENAARSEDISYVTGSRFFQAAAGELYSEEENLVFAGGGTSGLPSEKSQTASAPCCFLSSMPFSNILRIHDEPAMDCRI